MHLVRGPVFGLVMVGGLLFGLLGYLLRPDAPIVGQLPFHAVVSRGATLSGFEEFLLPAARTSFLYLLAGIVFGVLLGLAVALWIGPPAPVNPDKSLPG